MEDIVIIDPLKFEEDAVVVDDKILACRGCLSTGVTLYDLHSHEFAQVFGDLTGVEVLRTDDYPQYMCDMCLHYLRKFSKFRIKCHTAMYVMDQLREQNAMVTTETISSLNISPLKPDLSMADITLTNYLLKPESIVKKQKETVKKIYIAEIKTKDTIDNVPSREEYIESEEEQCESVTEEDNEYALTKNEVDDFSNDSDDANVGIDNEARDVSPHETLTRLDDVDDIERDSKTESDFEWSLDKDDEEGLSEENIADIMKAVLDEGLHKKAKTFKELEHKAQLFSKSYNTEVIFMTKALLMEELEERKKYDSLSSKFRCDKCYRVFRTEETYARHMEKHNPTNGKFECEICKCRFGTRRWNTRHFYNAHTFKFVCKQCGRIDRNWSDAKKHFDSHKAINAVKSEQCGKLFEARKPYLKHLRKVHGSGAAAVACALCGDSFNGVVELRAHLNWAHKQSKRCDVCSMVFADDRIFKKHLENSTYKKCDPSKKPCPVCGMILDSDGERLQHCNSMHQVQYECPLCDKRFLSRILLISHKRQQHNLLPHTSNNRRKRTSKTKTEKPNYNKKLICEICGKGNHPNEATLRYHQRLHTGERPHRCSFCDKTFRLRVALGMHLKTHTGERKYQCPHCPKRFCQSQQLKTHKVVHTNEEPFACSICPKKYKYATSLRVHVNVTHRGLPGRKRKNKTATTAVDNDSN